MLIIPSIHIVHGVCGTQIASVAHEAHHAGGRDIYTQNPIDRARLLRKENAKMLHLRFLDRDAWDVSSLPLIRALREAVDVPFGISIPERIPSEAECRSIFEAGVQRVFLPEGAPESILFDFMARFPARKIIPVIEAAFPFEERLAEYRARGIERIAIELSRSDTLEAGTIDWQRLEAISTLAKEAGVLITMLHGVRGYPELKRLQSLGAPFDSLVLSRALNENRFPCQLIWREMEAEMAFECEPAARLDANLWSNPLAGVPHV